MPIKLVKAAVTVASTGGGSISTKTYMFLAPKGLYTNNITTAVGIAQLASDSPDKDEPIYSVAELIKTRKIIRIIARTKEGNVSRTVKMFCAKNKIGSVDDDLQGKIITVDGALVSGSTIISVVGKRDATFS